MPPFVYLDTCVLIGFSQGKHKALLGAFKSGLTPVYSDVTISDLQVSGDDNQHLKLLDQIGAWHICSNDQDDSQCSISEMSAIEREKFLRGNGSQNLRDAETANYQMLADLHRSSNLTTGDVLLRHMDGFTPILKELDEMLQSHGIPSPFAKMVADLGSGLSEAETQTVENYQKEAKQSTRGGSDAIANFAPPKIIEQILNRMSDKDKKEFSSILALDPVTLTGVVESAIMLSFLGFGRDKKLLRPDDAIVMKAARSETHDSQHISFGLRCCAFGTSDKGAAIKAYALAEYYGLTSEVIYAPHGEPYAYTLDENNWIA